VPNPISGEVTFGQFAAGLMTLKWTAPLAGAAPAWILVTGDQAILLDAGLLAAPGSAIFGPDDVTTFDSLLAEPEAFGSSAGAAEMLRAVEAEFSTLASSLGGDYLVGLRPQAMTPVQVRTRRRPQPSESEQRLGCTVLLVPVRQGGGMAAALQDVHDWRLETDIPPTFGLEPPRPRLVMVPVAWDQDVTLIFRPQSRLWTDLRGTRLQFMSQATSWPSERSPAPHVAAFEWRGHSWLERAARGSDSGLWANADDLLHPLTGDVLIAMWAAGTEAAYQFAPSESTPSASLGEPGVRGWLAGPERPRRAFGQRGAVPIDAIDLTLSGPPADAASGGRR
jgi:hypothetical protein